MSFHVWQKVVCLKEGLWTQQYGPWPISYPVRGGIYTIREIETDPETGDVYFRFSELDNSRVPSDEGKEVGFWSIRFRPLIERKTEAGVAILRKIASDITTKIKEKV